jgi:hypothetical protein
VSSVGNRARSNNNPQLRFDEKREKIWVSSIISSTVARAPLQRALLFIAAAKITANAHDKVHSSPMTKQLSTDSGSKIVNKVERMMIGRNLLRL